MANVVSDLLATGVWHLGLFIVATRLHGSGAAVLLYDRLEAWMGASGAQWLRLGVVRGNVRAERFWERRAYVEMRERTGPDGRKDERGSGDGEAARRRHVCRLPCAGAA